MYRMYAIIFTILNRNLLSTVVGHEKTVLYAVLANDVQTLREILPKRPVLVSHLFLTC